jgi:AcrR family transcriptional regulator
MKEQPPSGAEPAPQGSRREEAKGHRRRRIVEAARALIRETGDTGLTMRAIAARAEVSLSTPYNLYGSKRAIVVAILDDVEEFQERFAKFKNSDAVERIFKALAIMLDYHRADPDFYRPLWASLLSPSDSPELQAVLSTPKSALFWHGLLREAARQGALRPDIDLDLLQQDLAFTFAAAMLTWVMGGLKVEELEPTIGHGYALTLSAAATDAHRPATWKRVLEYQKRLRQMRKRANVA